MPSDRSKRIPKSVHTETTAFGSYTLADLAVGLAPAAGVVVLTRILVPAGATVLGVRLQSLTLPLVGLAIVVGAVVVSMTPAYTTSVDWLGTVLGYLTSDGVLEHPTAREQPQVQRIHPEFDAIERTDGAVVGLLQVDPPAMGLATEDEWTRMADSFEEFLNTVVEFPLQLYATTEPFPVDEYLAHYERRLDDPDVQGNTQLARLIDGYVDWYRSALDRRQPTIRDHYVVVAVTRREVRFDGEDGLVDQLADVPRLGLLVEALFGEPEVERRARQFETLAERLRRVENGLRDVEGCTARQLSVEDAVDVLEDFWTGAPESDAGDVDVRTRPVVGGDR